MHALTAGVDLDFFNSALGFFHRYRFALGVGAFLAGFAASPSPVVFVEADVALSKSTPAVG